MEVSFFYFSPMELRFFCFLLLFLVFIPFMNPTFPDAPTACGFHPSYERHFSPMPPPLLAFIRPLYEPLSHQKQKRNRAHHTLHSPVPYYSANFSFNRARVISAVLPTCQSANFIRSGVPTPTANIFAPFIA